MESEQRIYSHFMASIEAKQTAADVLPAIINAAAEKMVQCLINGGKILTCGNGGSAGDAGDFVRRRFACGGDERGFGIVTTAKEI